MRVLSFDVRFSGLKRRIAAETFRYRAYGSCGECRTTSLGTPPSDPAEQALPAPEFRASRRRNSRLSLCGLEECFRDAEADVLSPITLQQPGAASLFNNTSVLGASFALELRLPRFLRADTGDGLPCTACDPRIAPAFFPYFRRSHRGTYEATY